MARAETSVVGVRLTVPDREIIESAAKATGQSIPSYMRAAALEKADPSVATPPPPPHDPGEGVTPRRSGSPPAMRATPPEAPLRTISTRKASRAISTIPRPPATRVDPKECGHPITRRIGDQCGQCGITLAKGKR